jgi:hypothetical protein
MPDAPDAAITVQDIEETCARQPIALAPRIDHRPVPVAAESHARYRNNAASTGKGAAESLLAWLSPSEEAREGRIGEQVQAAPTKLKWRDA